MHLESAVQRQGLVQSLGVAKAVFQEIGHLVTEIRMHTVLDDEPRALLGG